MLRPLELTEGIIGLCNGNMACGTCHVYVEEDRVADFPDIDEYEEEMLAELGTREMNSRRDRPDLGYSGSAVLWSNS